jgi:hypothetical protein
MPFRFLHLRLADTHANRKCDGYRFGYYTKAVPVRFVRHSLLTSKLKTEYKMKVFFVIVACIIFFACGKNNDASADPLGRPAKFEDFVGKYMVHDSTVTRDPGVVYTQLIGKGKGSDQMVRADGKIEVYNTVTPSRFMNYEFKAPDTLFVWDIGTDKHYNWYSNVSFPRKNHFIMTLKIQSRIIENHFTAE